MKKLFLLLSLLITGCTVNSFVRPLPPSVDIDHITNAIVSAEFTAADFDWTKNNLFVSLYSEDIYDSTQLHFLKIGDSILYDDDTIVVNHIENVDGYVIVNKGIEEWGAEFKKYEEGTYRANHFDDHSLYSKIGDIRLPLDRNFTIIDCGNLYTDPYDTICMEPKKYIENLEGHKRYFSRLNTKMKIEKGVVTQIIRRWIP